MVPNGVHTLALAPIGRTELQACTRLGSCFPLCVSCLFICSGGLGILFPARRCWGRRESAPCLLMFPASGGVLLQTQTCLLTYIHTYLSTFPRVASFCSCCCRSSSPRHPRHATGDLHRMRTPDLLHLVRYESGGPPLPPALLQEDGRAVRAALHGIAWVWLNTPPSQRSATPTCVFS